MKRSAVVVMLAAVLTGVAASSAGASHTPDGLPLDQDFVTGEEVTDFLPGGTSGPIRFIYVFDAHSGPDGQSASGTFRQDVESLSLGPESRHTFLTARVTCLNVTGNRATIGVELPPELPAEVRWTLLSVEDNDGAGQDKTGSLLTGEAATVCPANASIPLSPIFGGDITVHDAQPFPTTTQQCKNGRWRDFPGFENQGDCVSFVATRGKNPPANNP
jgi:hypothetical protein